MSTRGVYFKFRRRPGALIQGGRLFEGGRVVYSVPNYPVRTPKSKMAANKVREKVTSQADVMRYPADAMWVGEAPCLGVRFGEVR